MTEQGRSFEPVPAKRGHEPLAIGLVGPPAGGKTFSALRLAKGMQDVLGGDIHLIDTERGRARKYADLFTFQHVDFKPPHRPSDFRAALVAQLKHKPCCIIVDSMSDEHEGIGGYLEYHDELVPKFGGNEWAAWSKPKAERKRLITAVLQILTPMIFTFRAREKTQQVVSSSGKREVKQLGWQPVAPLEIVHALDLTCLLPPRADGTPQWKSDKVGEDFIVKLPHQFKALFQASRPLDEATGRALAEWARGNPLAGAPAEVEPEAAELADAALIERANAAADLGEAAFSTLHQALTDSERQKLEPHYAAIWDRIDAAKAKQERE